MIGDFSNLNRCCGYVKAFAAYNMVMIHGVATFLPVLEKYGFWQTSHPGFTHFRSYFSMCLPAFGGFYLRHVFGPYLKGNKLEVPWAEKALLLFLVCSILEGIRSYLSLWSFYYILNWHALHFLSLSVIFTCFIASKNERYIAPVAIILVFSHLMIRKVLLPFQLQPENFGPDLQLLGSWIWALVVAGGVGLALHKLSRIKFKILIAIVVISSCFIQPAIFEKKDALYSLVSLPLSIFVINLKDHNYWPLLTFYPVFSFGYFLRSYFYNLENKRSFKFVTLGMVSIFILAMWMHLPSVLGLRGKHHFLNKDLFLADSLTLICLVSGFYLCWIFSFYLFRVPVFRRLDFLMKWSDNIILLYVVHSSVFVFIFRNFPFSYLERMLPYELLLPSIYILLHACCFLSFIVTKAVEFVIFKLVSLKGVIKNEQFI